MRERGSANRRNGKHNMKVFVSFLLGLLVGVAGLWFFSESRVSIVERDRGVEVDELDLDRPVVATDRTRATDPDRLEVRERVNAGNDVSDSLDRAGAVIRERVEQAGSVIADATSDARITASIKTKLMQDSELSALEIDVDTDNGVVTLSGEAPSRQAIDRAMEIALGIDGVTKVASTLQVRP